MNESPEELLVLLDASVRDCYELVRRIHALNDPAATFAAEMVVQRAGLPTEPVQQ